VVFSVAVRIAREGCVKKVDEHLWTDLATAGGGGEGDGCTRGIDCDMFTEEWCHFLFPSVQQAVQYMAE